MGMAGVARRLEKKRNLSATVVTVFARARAALPGHALPGHCTVDHNLASTVFWDPSGPGSRLALFNPHCALCFSFLQCDFRIKPDRNHSVRRGFGSGPWPRYRCTHTATRWPSYAYISGTSRTARPQRRERSTTTTRGRRMRPVSPHEGAAGIRQASADVQGQQGKGARSTGIPVPGHL